MRKWEGHLVVGISALIVGIILFAWAIQAVEPIMVDIHTHTNVFGEKILDNVNISLDPFFMYPLVFGSLFVGAGLIEIGVVWEFYKLEKQIEEKKPGVMVGLKKEGKLFCRYCGKENKPDAQYCEACGKKL